MSQSPRFPTTTCNFSRSGCLDSSETPSRRFPSPFTPFRLVSVAGWVTFDRVEAAVGCIRSPSVGREEGADGSRGCGGDSDEFDLAVARLSTRVAVVVTQVTLVELGET